MGLFLYYNSRQYDGYSSICEKVQFLFTETTISTIISHNYYSRENPSIVILIEIRSLYTSHTCTYCKIFHFGPENIRGSPSTFRRHIRFEAR